MLVKTLKAGINLDDDDLVEGVSLKPLQNQQYSTTASSHTSRNKQNEKDKNEKNISKSVKAQVSENYNGTENENENGKQQNYEDLQNQKQHSTAATPSLPSSEDEQPQKILWQEQYQHKRDTNLNTGYCHLAKVLERDFNKTVLLWPCPHMKVSTR